jgi:hypothetical protein
MGRSQAQGTTQASTEGGKNVVIVKNGKNTTVAELVAF